MEGSLQQISMAELPDSIGTPPSTRLVESVKHQGVMQPIVVARTVDDAGEIGLEVIDGNRRIAAARNAGATSLPAIVLDGLTSRQMAEWTLIANGFRQANYLTENQALQRLKSFGYHPNDIQQLSGMAKSSLDVRNRLDRLIPSLLNALRLGTISQTDAVTASKLHQDDQVTLSLFLDRNGHLRRADIMKMFPELANKSNAAEDLEMQQPTMSTLQNLVLETVSIAGRLEVDRDRLLEMVMSAWSENNPDQE